MRTYQDLQVIAEQQNEKLKADWVYETIKYHKTTDLYKEAVIADDYANRRNTTIVSYQKLLYTMEGQAVPDNYSANYKLCHNFFERFLTQLNQFLLGNGITWGKEGTKERLGDEFDHEVQTIGRYALQDGRAFGFANNDKLEVFNVREFVPLYDENNSALKSGIRFWQIDQNKPLTGILYELDGYTEYKWNIKHIENGKVEVETEIGEKKTYKQLKVTNPTDGERVYNYENYEGFPIVPLYGNESKQSELIGRRAQIDAYDLIKSGFANDLDDVSQIYWTLENAGGMDDIDLKKFIEHMKVVKASVLDDNVRAESHTIDVPYASREALLDRLKSDLFDDFMMLDTKAISAGAITATQIKSSYEPLNEKADAYEYQVIEFIKTVLKLWGIDDVPTFTRSYITNVQETIQVLVQSAQYLPESYITEKIVTVLGDADRLEEIKGQMSEESLNNYGLDARTNRQKVEDLGEEA